MRQDEALRVLLLDLFAGDLLRFLAFLEQIDPKLTAEIPRYLSPIDTVDDAIRRLRGRGLLSDDPGRRFFRDLLEERPHRSDAIDEVFQGYFPGESLRMPPPPRPEDITGQIERRDNPVYVPHPQGTVPVPLVLVRRGSICRWHPGPPVPPELSLSFYNTPHPHLFLEPPNYLSHGPSSKAQTISLDARRAVDLVQRQPSRKLIRMLIEPGEIHGESRIYSPMLGLRFHVKAILKGPLIVLSLPGASAPDTLVWFSE